MIYIIYYYSSNKLEVKEEFESAYLCGLINSFSNAQIILRHPDNNFSSLNIDNTHENTYFIKLYNSESLTIFEKDFEFLKRMIHKTKIYLFGTFSKVNYELILNRYQEINAVLVDETESTCYDLLKNNIPDYECEGIATMHEGKLIFKERHNFIDMDIIPSANRKIALDLKQSFAEVEFSKGCLYNCNFCTEARRKLVRFKNINRSIDELEYLHKYHCIKKFTFKDLSFEDRNLLINNNQLDLFADEILKRNLSIEYSVHFRANTFTEKDIPLLLKLRKSGLINCLVGVESFCDSDLEYFGKAITGANNINFIALLEKCYIEPSCSFIFINPITTIENIQYNFDICYKLGLTSFLPPLLNVMIVYKHTRICEILKAQDMIYFDKNNPYDVLVNYRNKEVEQLSKVFKESFNDKKVWNTFFAIKSINLIIKTLNFKYRGNLVLEKNLINMVNETLNDINLLNYKMLINVIQNNKISNQSAILKKYCEDFNIEYAYKLHDYRVKLKKELKANERISGF